MSVTFPTLSRHPKERGGLTETKDFDPSLRTRPEDGKVISRARQTAVKRRWRVGYSNMTDADKSALESMESEALIGADTIAWTHPKTDEPITVRLAGPIEYRVQPTNADLWEIEFEVVEA